MVFRLWGVAAAALALSLLGGCDLQSISELQVGASTEADVRARFGEPERVWDEPGGARTFEYNRQPAGAVNYMITIGPEGRMTALRQVLTPAEFAQITPGMTVDEVRRRLGKPMKVMSYTLKGETAWDWRWNDGGTQPMIFTATFGSNGQVLRTGSVVEMNQDGR
ncbi:MULTISPECIES: outer membrane protein assembly factor BamE [unclassified Acidovorax]|uniref:outer membrane protein assembly factor BamE n=1 Tax=unclassified Acidovorax TaxID=2684926 RepID=UPI0028833334|nr:MULTISPECIES: outer membrane protein assembly factor BamE [unclassified Acidovorax]